jgi:hypothetical protein
MMEKIKRRAFEAGLAAIVGVIVLAVGLGTWLTYGRDTARIRTTLNNTKSQAQNLLTNTLFSKELVDKMRALVDLRKHDYDDLLKFIRTESAKRLPLVKNLKFPTTDVSIRMATKASYNDELAKFMKMLGAAKPVMEPYVGGAGQPEKMRMTDASRRVMMFADVKKSFTRPEWVDSTEAPNPDAVRVGQENLWLMEDVVSLIAETNRDLLAEIKKKDPRAKDEVGWAPVKELIEIRIGADAAVLPGTKMPAASGRYRPFGSAKPASGAAKGIPSLSGRASVAGFYNVLPFRVGVVVDARYYGEVVRRLKDRESFITVEAWKVSPLDTEVQFARSRDLVASSLDDYGRKEDDQIKRDALVRLEVSGESLAWTLDGGRVTAQATSTGTAPTKPGEASPAPTTSGKTN